MFFEGSEKKLELILNNKSINLRSWSRERIDELVAASQAQILSSIHNEKCDAYLLSESSLFVWKDRLTMITCGQTTLVNAALKLQSWVKPDDVACLFYQRKNEYLPQQQKTDFFQDQQLLQEIYAGESYRFGRADEHHLYLYHSAAPYRPETNDTTLEILMYDLQGVAYDVFNAEGQSKAAIHEKTQVHKILDGFEVDDFVFEPFGYSLNAIKDDSYYTIHITPQDSGPYVSFETNINTDCDYKDVIQKVLSAFKPMSYDIVYHSPNRAEDIRVEGDIKRSFVRQELSCGYHVQFVHFFNENNKTQKAFKLEGK